MAWGTPPHCNPALSWSRGTELRAPVRRHISCFPPAHCHGRFTPDSVRATAGYCDGTPNIEFATEERGHEGWPRVAANFWIRTFILRPSGVSEPMSLIVVLTCTAVGGWPHSQCAGWDLLEPRNREREIHKERNAGELSPGVRHAECLSCLEALGFRKKQRVPGNTVQTPHSVLRPPQLTMVNLLRSLSLLLSAGAAYASLQIVPGATVTGVSHFLYTAAICNGGTASH